MSECAVHTLNVHSGFKFKSVGTTVPGAETKIYSPDIEGNGEICIYGRHVFMGYLSDPVNTMEAIDTNGWLHSGDVGKVDEQGFVFVTGRIKVFAKRLFSFFHCFIHRFLISLNFFRKYL